MFHITVVNNDDSKVLLDKDADTIIGGMTNKADASSLGFCNAPPASIVLACYTAKKAIDKLCDDDEALSIVLKFAEMLASSTSSSNILEDYEKEVREKAKKNSDE